MPRLTLERTLAAFREMEGFIPYQFYCAVSPPWNGGRVREKPYVVPAFHYAEESARCEVGVHWDGGTAWPRDVVRSLKLAGYDATRWARGALA